jgi:hypothetical protein
MVLESTWLYTKIGFVAFAISNIFGCNNLCHLSCDFYDYVGCKQDKVNNLTTLSKLEQVDLKYQQNPL